MIVKNPTNGAPVKRRVGMKIWQLGVGKTLDFPDIVGEELIAAYGFLEEVKEGQKPEALLIDKGFKCSICDYQSSVKVAVLNHMKKHKEEKIEYQKAEPVGEAQKKMSLLESRAERSRIVAEQMPGGQGPEDMPGFYGEKFEET